MRPFCIFPGGRTWCGPCWRWAEAFYLPVIQFAIFSWAIRNVPALSKVLETLSVSEPAQPGSI